MQVKNEDQVPACNYPERVIKKGRVEGKDREESRREYLEESSKDAISPESLVVCVTTRPYLSLEGPIK